MPKPFRHVGKLRPRRSRFDLTHSKLGTCYLGELIPVMCQEVIPGDTFKIGCECIIRMQPMVAPILHEVNATVHYFFVPYRLLDFHYRVRTTGVKVPLFDWEAFITGGLSGNVALPLPRWSPTADDFKSGSLWDHFGFPMYNTVQSITGYDALPHAFPYAAYALVWFEYYRDSDLQSGLGHDSIPSSYPFESPAWNKGSPLVPGYNNFVRPGMPMWRNWEKDYFTSARSSPQRGQAPALPLRGNIPVGLYSTVDQPVGVFLQAHGYVSPGGTPGWQPAQVTANVPNDNGYMGNFVGAGNLAATFNVADLRLAFQIQKFLERNMRAGSRYVDFLRAHFGVSPSDARLDRPEYIGGHRSPVVVSEVLQTSKSETNAPQGNMSGHGLNASSSYVGSYNVAEYGLILGLLSVMPKPLYQQGINRQWLRYSRFDFYSPEFAHLSEQGIYRSELYWQGAVTTGTPMTGLTPDSQIFGFQGRWDEFRVAHSMAVSEMRQVAGRPNLAFWHLGRNFSVPPTLSSQFLRMDGTQFQRVFAVTDRPNLIYHVNNLVTAVRPLPPISDPGLADHH